MYDQKVASYHFGNSLKYTPKKVWHTQRRDFKSFIIFIPGFPCSKIKVYKNLHEKTLWTESIIGKTSSLRFPR